MILLFSWSLFLHVTNFFHDVIAMWVYGMITNWLGVTYYRVSNFG